MAYNNCAASLAANIAVDCANPIIGGYTGMGVLIPAENASFVQNAQNPRKVESIAVTGSTYVVDNCFTEPFSGSSTAGNTDTGFTMFNKTISIKVPLRGAAVSENIVEALCQGKFVMVVEKKDRVGDGSFEVIGMQSPLVVDAGSVSRDESANGGCWVLSLTCSEYYAEVALVGEDGTYASAKEAWTELLNKAV